MRLIFAAQNARRNHRSSITRKIIGIHFDRPWKLVDEVIAAD
jgi:hypothetical protein